MHWFRRPAVLGDHYDRSALDELRFSRLFQDLGLNFVNNLRFTDPDDYGFKSTRLGRIANLNINEDDGERAQGSDSCRHSSSRGEEP
jgi:hypothetical protein